MKKRRVNCIIVLVIVNTPVKLELNVIIIEFKALTEHREVKAITIKKQTKR